MNYRSHNPQSGFSLIEIAAVLAIISVLAAIATPKIVGAMRQYRLNMAVQQILNLVQQGRAQAVSENRKASLVVDTSNRKFGLIVYDSSGSVVRTDYVVLPDGVNFASPASNSAPVTGAPTSANVSFPAQGSSTTVFQQDFTSRGFLNVATPGTINAIYFGSITDYRAIIITSVGGMRTFRWQASSWQSMKN